MIDQLKTIGAGVSGFVALFSGYLFFGGPVPVTKSYVEAEVVRPLNDLSLSVLKDRRALRATQLFQWERNNPSENRTEHASLMIHQLKEDIAEIDRQITRYSRGTQ